MIKVECREGHMTGMANGSLQEITADTIMIIHRMWEFFKGQEDGSADVYKTMLEMAFEDGICFFDDEDVLKTCAVAVSKRLESLEKQLEKILANGSEI